MCQLGLAHTEDRPCQTDRPTVNPQGMFYSYVLPPSPEQQEHDSVSGPHGNWRLPMSDWHSDRPTVSPQGMFYSSVLPPLRSSKNVTVSTVSVSVPCGNWRLPMSDWHSDRPTVSPQSMFYSPSPEQQEHDSVTVSVPLGATPQEQLGGNMEDLLNTSLHLHHQSDHLRQNHTQNQMQKKKKLFKKTKTMHTLP